MKKSLSKKSSNLLFSFFGFEVEGDAVTSGTFSAATSATGVAPGDFCFFLAILYNAESYTRDKKKGKM